MTLTMKFTFLAFAATAALTFSTSAFSAGGGSDASAPQCGQGKVYDESSKKCVDKSSRLDDDTIYRAARDYAYAGRYGEALDMLARASNQGDSRILTYYGYTNRKLGNVAVAMDYYNRAIAADANNLLARSYMGQGLVQQGDLEAARAQLVEIRDRGGRESDAYRALYEALKTGSTY